MKKLKYKPGTKLIYVGSEHQYFKKGEIYTVSIPNNTYPNDYKLSNPKLTLQSPFVENKNNFVPASWQAIFRK